MSLSSLLYTLRNFVPLEEVSSRYNLSTSVLGSEDLSNKRKAASNMPQADRLRITGYRLHNGTHFWFQRNPSTLKEAFSCLLSFGARNPLRVPRKPISNEQPCCISVGIARCVPSGAHFGFQRNPMFLEEAFSHLLVVGAWRPLWVPMC